VRSDSVGPQHVVGTNVPSFSPVDSRFLFPRTPVGIVDYGDTGEALLVRAILESLGAVTLLHLPGTPEDFLRCLEQGEAAPPYLVLCGHGDETGFVFGEYGEGIDTSALVGTSLPPAALTGRVRLPGCVVLSTACLSGREELGRAFLQGRVRAYVAPDDYPLGADVPLFVMHFFHRLLARGAGVEEAWAHAAGYDEPSRMFVCHTPTGVRRLASR
jgi:hypothetical protein